MKKIIKIITIVLLLLFSINSIVISAEFGLIENHKSLFYFLISITNYIFIFLIISGFILLIISELTSNNQTLILAIYYLFIFLALLFFVYTKFIFYMPGNGRLFAYPGIASFIVLIALTGIGIFKLRMKRKELIIKPWITFLFSIMLILLITWLK